jgi:uncharacterized membrane protein
MLLVVMAMFFGLCFTAWGQAAWSVRPMLCSERAFCSVLAGISMLISGACFFKALQGG